MTWVAVDGVVGDAVSLPGGLGRFWSLSAPSAVKLESIGSGVLIGITMMTVLTAAAG